MSTNWRDDAAIPPDVRAGLGGFCDQLQKAAGENLVALILYGGLARGEFVPERSDVNVLVVLKEGGIAVLDRATPILESATLGFRLTHMVITEADLPYACDVFPTKFLDIQRHHKVLFGRDVACDLPIPRDRLKRQCMREVMNLQLRLRHLYVKKRDRTELLERVLIRSLSTILFNLSVLVELKTGEPAPAKANLPAALEKLGFDGKLIRELQALKNGELKPGAEEIKALYDGCLSMVHQVVSKLATL